MEAQKILSVSDVNQYIKRMLDRDAKLMSLCIRGELSNYKVYPSGHHYFTLKDSDGALRCVLFKSNAVRLRFRPENGIKVLAFGRVTVFPRDGVYQLYCEQLTPEGDGELYAAYEQLKGKLQRMGIFDEKHKKPIPKYPERIAIVTSSAGAAIHDMLRILAERYPLAKIIVLPVRVQGKEAPAEICGAIRYVNRFRLADVIITGRGGGSIEDLWAFNDERLAMTIYQSEIPVISAVGHEPDVTISDYAADLRAATPSNAAELVVPDRQEIQKTLVSMQKRMMQAQSRQLHMYRQRLDALRSNQNLQSPLNYLQDRRILLDFEQKQLISSVRHLLGEKKQSYVAAVAALDAMSPLKVLARGYSMTIDSAGDVITDAHMLRRGSSITVRLKNGEIDGVVTDIRGGKNAGNKEF